MRNPSPYQRSIKKHPIYPNLATSGEGFIKQVFYELQNYVPFLFFDLFYITGLDNLTKEISELGNNEAFESYLTYVATLRSLTEFTLNETNLTQHLQSILKDKTTPNYIKQVVNPFLNSTSNVYHTANQIRTLLLSIDQKNNLTTIYKKLLEPYPHMQYESESKQTKAAMFIFSTIKKFLTPIYIRRLTTKTDQIYTSYLSIHLNKTWFSQHYRKKPWIKQLPLCGILNHQPLPMLHKPRIWTRKRLSGGYLLNDIIQTNWIKTNNDGDHLVKLVESGPLHSLNHLNGTQFRVNNELLAILNQNVDLLNFDERNTLKTFNRLQNKTFHFQHQIDFRGRIYPLEYSLHPMSSDLAKALIEFSKPTQTTNVTQLKYYTAATFLRTNRNLSNNELLEIFEKKFKNKLEMELTKKNIKNLFKKYSKSWILIRLVLEFKNIPKNPYLGYSSHLPIYYDCTASVFQCATLVLGNYGYLKQLNFIPQTQDHKRNDFYTTLIQDYFDELHLTLDASSLQLLRKVLKSFIVAAIYGLSTTGFQKLIKRFKYVAPIAQVAENLQTDVAEIHEHFELFWHDIQNLPPFKYLYFAQLNAKYIPDTEWVHDLIVETLYVDAQGNVEIQKSQRAVGANFFQSIDAMIMHSLLSRFRNPNIIAIHDCWGFPIATFEELLFAIKAALLPFLENDFEVGNYAFNGILDGFQEAIDYYDIFFEFYYKTINPANIKKSLHLISPS